MTNAFDHENTPFGSYGEFDTYGLPTTDEEWAEYDAYIATEMAEFDAEISDSDAYDLWAECQDAEPPF